MISTKQILSIEDVPDLWIFQYYCKLNPENELGKRVKIKSLFNDKDNTPSMFIYNKESKWAFKDFSSGRSGDSISLVMQLYDLDYFTACNRILRDFKSSDGVINFKLSARDYKIYKVTDYKIRGWNILDKNYWSPYLIGSRLLEHYRIFPLQYYVLENGDNSIDISRNYIYGFFNQNKELCKIYQPKNKSCKFIKVKDYIQGSEQLTFTHSTLLIVSSMKDGLCTTMMSLDSEFIAPDSENSLIPDDMIKMYISSYEYVYVIFDNDATGLRCMKKYNEKYGLPYCQISISKDIAAGVELESFKATEEDLIECIKNHKNE
jgi:hypothetical protein